MSDHLFFSCPVTKVIWGITVQRFALVKQTDQIPMISSRSGFLRHFSREINITCLGCQSSAGQFGSVRTKCVLKKKID
jgi:hypothetical protein